jgi:hypothetical protein
MHRMIIDGGTRLGEAPDKLAVSLCELAGVSVEVQLMRASLDIRSNCSQKSMLDIRCKRLASSDYG